MLRKKIGVAILFAAAIPATSLTAQSLCDLLPASAVQSALGLSTPLTATPNTQGGNGCDYKVASPGPIVVMADTADDSGFTQTYFNQRLSQPGSGGQAISGIGDGAYYTENRRNSFPKYPGINFAKQDLVFRAKGKITSFVCTFQGNGVPKSALLALGQLALSKPLNTLKGQ
jgi:hypothetical protein